MRGVNVEARSDIPAFDELASGAPSIDARLADAMAIRRTGATIATPESAARESAAHDPGDGAPQADPDEAGARLIRPYTMTGGRTAGHVEISLEAQIQTSTRLDGDTAKYRWEAAKILQLAERPMALVELAARAEIPIGVARVVVSDLVDAGAIHVQRNAPITSYTSLLEKVLDGIRDL